VWRAGGGPGNSVRLELVRASAADLTGASVSQGGRGSIRPPLISSPPPRLGSSNPPAPTSGTRPVANALRGKVLVIDDEPAMGRIMTRLLGEEHDVTAVTSGPEALALFEKGARFDVILCDLMMPQMTGAQFYERLAELVPEQLAGVVMLTGGAFTPDASAFVSSRQIGVLEKPFEPRRLRAEVERRVRARSAKSSSS
jgi:CheY-like chemotaxis protein